MPNIIKTMAIGNTVVVNRLNSMALGQPLWLKLLEYLIELDFNFALAPLHRQFAIEYWQTVSTLRRRYRCTDRKYPLSLAALLVGLGVAMLAEALL
jgi:hypothetical protein